MRLWSDVRRILASRKKACSKQNSRQCPRCSVDSLFVGVQTPTSCSYFLWTTSICSPPSTSINELPCLFILIYMWSTAKPPSTSLFSYWCVITCLLIYNMFLLQARLWTSWALVYVRYTLFLLIKPESLVYSFRMYGIHVKYIIMCMSLTRHFVSQAEAVALD